MKKLLLAAAVAAVAASTVAAGPASGLTMTGCPAGPVVANVTLALTGTLVAGLDGHIWAVANSQETVIVYNTGTDRYCISTRDTGSFVTRVGPSPASAGAYYRSLSAGIAGTLVTSTSSTVFTGTWRNDAPTTGALPAVCTYAPCDYLADRFVTARVGGDAYTWYVGQYRTAHNGLWQTRLDIPSTYDIFDVT